jgi:hypothetical protein
VKLTFVLVTAIVLIAATSAAAYLTIDMWKGFGLEFRAAYALGMVDMVRYLAEVDSVALANGNRLDLKGMSRTLDQCVSGKTFSDLEAIANGAVVAHSPREGTAVGAIFGALLTCGGK